MTSKRICSGAFDVIKHKFSGDTNPYDIDEVLVKFQQIDPGYETIPILPCGELHV